jgi:hypothetical protein
VESLVGLKLLAEEDMGPSLVKLELLLEKGMVESLVKLELLLGGEDGWTLGEVGFEAC